MDEIKKFDDEYKTWITEISNRYKACQIKAAVSVNRELISFYWSLGKDIVEKQAENRYGVQFYNRLSSDLKNELPGVSGFAVSNLRYIKRFYNLYANPNRPQLVGDFENKNDNIKVPQLVAELTEEELFSVPWGHHRLIMDRCKGDGGMAAFFVKKILQNNWSRSVLLNLDSASSI